MGVWAKEHSLSAAAAPVLSPAHSLAPVGITPYLWFYHVRRDHWTTLTEKGPSGKNHRAKAVSSPGSGSRHWMGMGQSDCRVSRVDPQVPYAGEGDAEQQETPQGGRCFISFWTSCVRWEGGRPRLPAVRIFVMTRSLLAMSAWSSQLIPPEPPSYFGEATGASCLGCDSVYECSLHI